MIDWSWWWVTVPFWGGIALFAVVIFLILFIYYTIEEKRYEKELNRLRSK